jgi:hypothetical protein
MGNFPQVVVAQRFVPMQSFFQEFSCPLYQKFGKKSKSFGA